MSPQGPRTRSHAASNLPAPPIAATGRPADASKNTESSDAEESEESSAFSPTGMANDTDAGEAEESHAFIPPGPPARKLSPEIMRRRLIGRLEAGQSINPLQVSTAPKGTTGTQ